VRKESSTAQTSDFRRADFTLLKELVDGMPQEADPEDKGAQESWHMHMHPASPWMVYPDTQKKQNV